MFFQVDAVGHNDDLPNFRVILRCDDECIAAFDTHLWVEDQHLDLFAQAWGRDFRIPEGVLADLLGDMKMIVMSRREQAALARQRLGSVTTDEDGFIPMDEEDLQT